MAASFASLARIVLEALLGAFTHGRVVERGDPPAFVSPDDHQGLEHVVTHVPVTARASDGERDGDLVVEAAEVDREVETPGEEGGELQWRTNRETWPVGAGARLLDEARAATV